MDLPGARELLKQRAEEQILAAGEGGISTAQLLGELPSSDGDSGWPEIVEETLRELEIEGLVVSRTDRWLAVRYTGLILGTVQRLERGDALVRTGRDGEPGLLIPRANQRGALDGDWVLARRDRDRSRQRGGRPTLPRGSIFRVLRSTWDRMVVRVTLVDDRVLCRPFDPRLDHEIELRSGRGSDLTHLAVGDYAEVELVRGSGRSDRMRAKLIERLGHPSEPGVDVEVIVRHRQIPDRFPAAVVAAGERLPPDPGEAEFAGREDLRGRPIVTIDGESARDFDDAISVEVISAGSASSSPASGRILRLGIHIADVAQYVAEGSLLDVEAYRRGTSVYYPDRVLPMFPERLSNGLCSLRPDVPRLTLSVFLDVDSTGTVLRRRFAETVIQSVRRLTYDEVRDRLAEPIRQGFEQSDPEVQELLELAEEAMGWLLAARRERGSLDFDLPSGDVILDTDGRMVGVQPTERHVAHRMIEELMIAANEAVAFELNSNEKTALYRAHDPPEADRLEELAEILRPLGLSLPKDTSELSPAALENLLEQVQGHDEEAFVSSLVLRSMQRAVYRSTSDGHYALSSRDYTHFTSPIRRYPDLLVHRQLKQLHGRGTEQQTPASKSPASNHRVPLAPRIDAIAEHCSSTERRAERSERELLQWKKVRFLAERVGERFTGRITGVQKFGFFVQLDHYLVDGLVPMRSLGDDFYVFDPAKHRIEGSASGRRFQLADQVEVVLLGMDERTRGLRLEIADLHGGGGSRSGSRYDRGRGNGRSRRPRPQRRRR